MPFYYYYIPMMNSIVHSVYNVLTEANAQSPNIIGAKFTNDALPEFAKCATAGFNMLGGGDDILNQFLLEGGDGAVGIGFSCFGNMFNDIYDHCKKGNYQEATKI